MKQSNKNYVRLTVLVGVLVFALPLYFVNFLSSKIIERSRETSEELLKEKILQEVENFKERLSPQNYVKSIINKTHSATMPEARRSVIKLIPAKDFGREIFTPSLPEKFVAGLKDAGVKPLFFISCGPAFSSLDYWFAPELNEQIDDGVRNLAIALSHNVIGQASQVYYMNFQHNWFSLSSLNPVLAEIYAKQDFRYQYFCKYISRFTDPREDFDVVSRIYTDYFSRQFLYSYSWSCMSKVNIHGGYSVLIRGDSIDPEAIIKFAETNVDQEEISCRVIKNSATTGFQNSGETIVFNGFIPSEFFSHLSFWQQLNERHVEIPGPGMQFQVSGSFPEDYVKLKKVHMVIRIISVISLFFMSLVATHSFLFGFNLPLTIRKKLLAVVSLIFLLPVAATAILSYYLYNGFDKIVERHIRARVERKLDRLTELETEKRISLQQRMLQLKNAIQKTEKSIEIFLMPANILQHFPDMWNWLGSISFMDDQGLFKTIHATRESEFRLAEGLLGKYLINQGLARLSQRRARELEVKISLTMGLLENFLTPEIEEEIVPREGTIQREITHTVDTYIGCFLFCQNKNGESAFVNSRSSNLEKYYFDYLISMNMAGNKYFNEESSLCDIKSGIRLRKHSTFTNFLWPADIAFDNDFTPYLAKALTQRSSGTKIIRNQEGITVAAWRFRENYQGIYAVVGKSRKLNEIGLAISLLFPLTACYSIILLMILSGVLSRLFIEPIAEMQQGIAWINQNKFGITLDKARVSEFEKLNNAFNEMSVALKQKEMISRYLSDRLVENIEKRQSDSVEKIDQVEVTVLASDIRSFTAITEAFPPFEVVEMLNNYFTEMESAIVANSGVIDRFVGDAIVAIFYPEADQLTPAIRATRAAVQMRQNLVRFNCQRKSENQFLIENGIGLATGTVVSGTIGSEGRKTFLVTGEPTMVATQMEALSPESHSKILACQKTAELCESHFEFKVFKDRFHELLKEKSENA